MNFPAFFLVLAAVPPPGTPQPPAVPPAAAQAAQQAAGGIVGGIEGQIFTWYQQILDWIAGQNFVLQTGAGVTFQQPVIVKFWQANALVADAALALVVLWIAYNVIIGYYDPLQMLSRVVLAAVAIHASLTFISLFVSINNGLCASVVATAGVPNTADIAAFLYPNVHAVLGGQGDPGQVFQAVIIVLMTITVILQLIVRLGLLDLLIVLSPLALLLYIAPGTQKWANLWFGAFFTTLFLQFLQVTAIAVGAALITSLAATASIVSAIAGVAVLVFVLKIPGWLGSAVTSSIGGVQSPQQYALQAAQQAAQGFLTLVKTVL